jgi:K+-transporting ATPase ATPase C chain
VSAGSDHTFTARVYLHSRPSAAGNGYDAANSGGTNYGPTNQKLIDRVKADTERLQAENPGAPVPVELVTTSASGLDPDLSPAGAEFQVPRIAHERGLSEEQVRAIITRYSSPRQLGYLGEARINVLEVNLALDEVKPMAH